MLLQNEIIPEIQKESEGQFTTAELAQLIHVVDEFVKGYDDQIEVSSDVAERKQLRSELK